jgi:hypothetical protein
LPKSKPGSGSSFGVRQSPPVRAVGASWPSGGWDTGPFAILGSCDKPFDDYGVVGIAQLDRIDVQIGKAVHKALEQLSNGLLTVARVAVHLVTRTVEGSYCRLDVVPVFRLGVLIDDCLAAQAKAGDVVDRCHYGPPRCLDG